VAEPQPTEPADTISSGNAAMPAAASAFAPTPKIGIPLPRPRPGN
ncbi:penicillin-insensitive murein endopeptidase, partial [Mesorhizobium sp. M2A.F.Ca.ET.037.01.1.1]